MPPKHRQRVRVSAWACLGVSLSMALCWPSIAQQPSRSGDAATTASPTFAQATVTQAVPNAAVVGFGRYHYALWDIYEATLYAPAGRWRPEAPYALQLRYFRSLAGDDIADRSIKEMRDQGFNDEVTLAAWHAQLREIFPDVRDGSLLLGVYFPGLQTTFYDGSRELGSIKGDRFGEHFFAIWLGERSSAPNLRRQLLGQPQ